MQTLSAAALSLLSRLPADTPQGLPTSDKWPLLQTLGVFVGIPVAAMAAIVALVMLQAGTRRARGTSVTAVFTGPRAGSVDAAARSGTGPLTDTEQASGMHREVAQPDGGSGLSGSGHQDGGTGPDVDSDAGTGSTTAGATRLGSGGSGARW